MLKSKPEACEAQYRQSYHFTPKQNWMNDPNGLVYYQEEYHLFYQYHPFGLQWGPMHWGHAVSKDMVHWEHLDIALAPDENGMIFSGSAVVDWNDTTGFFNGKSGLVAIFTHHDTDPHSTKPRQRQSLAYSLDKGRTWIKYPHNPVLVDEAKIDFRDPKVFWYEETDKWIMTLAAGDRIDIYSSPNLKEWQYESSFEGPSGEKFGVWECPDLFKLPVVDHPEQTKWVLFVSHGDSPYGSRTQYFVGDFDGHSFKPSCMDHKVKWLDSGKDNYAGVTWSDMADGRRIYIGWMNNWRYANEIPAHGWRGAMTLPRELFLSSKDLLIQKPIKELENLRNEPIHMKNQLLAPDKDLLVNFQGNTCEMIVEFEFESGKDFGIRVFKSDNKETVIGYHVEKEEVYMDRRNSGETSFNEFFSSIDCAVIKAPNHRMKFQVFVDRSSIEVFVNNGEMAMTSLVFPDLFSKGIELFSNGGNVKLLTLDLYPLK
ncbi:glycoside hydrolase family 32 protein [Metabacillus sp. GX 13764]|uniref:glycoside hydrolase family 32 protein n=1 Tax=Metabacillus kandeliae TaxID=2900151 RepID=UPI001E465314|nr:glycoside hydrolase family 32 protein [Metabacillus kandeliae]MCD7034287.1 glycoside hydrolase family 32 protein [Metabacillus kandeliae]